jgi:hypothetical protein
MNRFDEQARSSGGERFPDTEEVVGSNPIVPTKQIKGLRFWPFPLFSFLLPFSMNLILMGSSLLRFV